MKDEEEERGASGESDEEIDFEYVRAAVGFVLRAPGRRPFLTAFLFVAIAALGLGAARAIPPTYRAELQLLARPSGGAESGKVDPIKYAVDVLRSRDTLARIVDETDLIARLDRARPPILKWGDRLLARFAGRRSDADRRNAIIGTLGSKLSVTLEDARVALRVDSADPQASYALVEHAREEFVRAVYEAQVKLALDRLDVVEEASKRAYANLQYALHAYAEEARAETRSVAPTGASGRPAPQSVLADEVAKKEQEVQESETQWRRTLSLRNDQLLEALGKYTANHPAVGQLQREVDVLGQPPAELVQWRHELAELRSRLEHEVRPPHPASTAAVAPSLEDGAMLLARSRLEAAMRSHEVADEATDRENVLVDVTRRQARDRFSVAMPAEVPTRPTKPIAQLVAGGSVVAAALLSLLLASALDLSRGKILESWQVRRRLKIDSLGELEDVRRDNDTAKAPAP